MASEKPTPKRSPARSCGEDQLLHLSRVADWAGLSYGKFMAKPPEVRAALIAAYDRHHAE